MWVKALARAPSDVGRVDMIQWWQQWSWRASRCCSRRRYHAMYASTSEITAEPIDVYAWWSLLIRCSYTLDPSCDLPRSLAASDYPTSLDHCVLPKDANDCKRGVEEHEGVSHQKALLVEM